MQLAKILVSLFIFALFHGLCFSQIPCPDIKLNQIGFYVKGPKTAVITAPVSGPDFYILSQEKLDTLWTGKLSEIRSSANSTTNTQLLDFSNFRKAGTYIVSVPGLNASYPFQIGSRVHHAIAVSSLKSFYYQRVSMPLEERYAGKWKRSAGHPDTSVLIHPSAATMQRSAGSTISTPGGWYDAGDYNKYIVNSGITMGTLFSAYEDFEIYFDTLTTNIPESGNSVPDLLDEALINLRWMLTMQDPADGGVYHKCTNAAFDGMVMPGVTTTSRYVVQKGTAATLDFAAVTAQASRIFKKFEKELPGLSDSCLRASKKAWGWALVHPQVAYDQEAINSKFDPKISTGAYGDRNFSDEWFWAAAELYTTTKDDSYTTRFARSLAAPLSIPSWANVQMLGIYSLLRYQSQFSSSLQTDLAPLKEKLIKMANGFIGSASTSAFATPMGQSRKDFVWGSNSVAANQSVLLINAYLLSGEKKYIKSAVANLDYLLGRNATGFSFVTGAGSRSTMNPHHRPSVADGVEEPVPGFLAGGPNPGMQDLKDGCNYTLKEPETAYVDADCSYASNEIAINWNAPLVYVANAIEALQNKAGYVQ